RPPSSRGADLDGHDADLRVRGARRGAGRPQLEQPARLDGRGAGGLALSALPHRSRGGPRSVRGSAAPGAADRAGAVRRGPRRAGTVLVGAARAIARPIARGGQEHRRWHAPGPRRRATDARWIDARWIDARWAA